MVLFFGKNLFLFIMLFVEGLYAKNQFNHLHYNLRLYSYMKEITIFRHMKHIKSDYRLRYIKTY